MALMAMFMFPLVALETVTFEQTSPIIWLPTKEYVDGGIVEYDLAATFINPCNVLQEDYDPFFKSMAPVPVQRGFRHKRQMNGGGRPTNQILGHLQNDVQPFQGPPMSPQADIPISPMQPAPWQPSKTEIEMREHSYMYTFGECNAVCEELGFYSLDQETVKASYKRASPLCHPDKNPAEQKTLATRAQQIMNQARITIQDPQKCFRYLDDGVPPAEYDHVNGELIPTLEFIKQKLAQSKPTSGTQSSSSSTSTPIFNQSFGFTFEKPESSSSNPDEKEQKNDTNTPEEEANNDKNYEQPSFNSSSRTSDGKRGRRRSIFTLTGYQCEGGKITYNEQRTQGCVYKMEWAAKPGYSSWLSEDDIIIQMRPETTFGD